jgi:hypothetical protein
VSCGLFRGFGGQIGPAQVIVASAVGWDRGGGGPRRGSRAVPLALTSDGVPGGWRGRSLAVSMKERSMSRCAFVEVAKPVVRRCGRAGRR